MKYYFVHYAGETQRVRARTYRAALNVANVVCWETVNPTARWQAYCTMRDGGFAEVRVHRDANLPVHMYPEPFNRPTNGLDQT